MTLNDTLLHAVTSCGHPAEEEGGIILVNNAAQTFQFVKLRNQNTGTPIAPVLWTADRDEYAKNVIPLFKDGWRHFASFHTHPKFVPFPSTIDINELFPGFSINYIYSQKTQEVTQWDYQKEDETVSFKLANAFQFSTSFNQINKLQITPDNG